MIAGNFPVPRCCNIFFCYIVDINYIVDIRGYRGLHSKLLQFCKTSVIEAYSSGDTVVSLYKHAPKEDFEIGDADKIAELYTSDPNFKFCNIEKIYGCIYSMERNQVC